ncbi:MAG TPA: hypothetical protein VNZ26_26520 [Vicinamibacterales bacterium]|jgi:hypothetical protein|nr:hypothetical protein [Vicinamibacterales bacterium]
MAPKACTVSFAGPTGIRHAVEVTADSLYEAAVLALNVMKKHDWIDHIAPGTELQVQVKEPPVTHSVSVQQLKRWVDGIAASPDELLRKNKLKALLTS